MSSTFQPGACSTSSRFASRRPVIPAIGAMLRANSTHTGSSALSVPSADTAVPPWRTASVSRVKHSTIRGDEMIEQRPQPPRRRLAARGERVDGGRAGGDLGEDVELDRGLDGGGALVSGEGVPH